MSLQELKQSFTLSVPQDGHQGDYRNIHIDNFSISARSPIFCDANLKINYGKHYGLIGPNGKGKTTLLNHINRKLLPVHPDLDVLLVEQEIQASDITAVQAVLDANEKKKRLEHEAEIIQRQIDKFEESDVDQSEINQLMDELNERLNELTFIGSDRDEARVRKILHGLGFTEKMQDSPTKLFSGGWRMRISIAKALYMEPTLMLLDEPTNHLDLNAVIWLTDYLSKWKKTLVVVSHDQNFLNNVCTDTLHIDNLKLHHYNGNYDSFKHQLTKVREKQIEDWEKLCKRIKQMKKGKKGLSKDEEKEMIKKSGLSEPSKEYIVRIGFNEPMVLTGTVIRTENLRFSYDGNNDIIKNVNFEIDNESRITIVGPNGAGKSTFMKLLAGHLKPTEGEVVRNACLRIGYYDQHFSNLNPNMTALEYLLSIKNVPEQEIRRYLGSIGLAGSIHHQKIGSLSGGQKARVALIACRLIDPHVLLMDEPTNHLDIESIQGLIQALNEYEGAVIMITHDMRLVTETESELWICEDYKIYSYDGDYEDYCDEILNQI